MTATGVDNAIAALLSVLADSALRAVILAAVLGAGLAMFRVRRTAWRLSTWTLVLWAALTMPALSRALPALRVPVSARALTWWPSAAEEAGSHSSQSEVHVRTSASGESTLLGPGSNPDTSSIAPYASVPIEEPVSTSMAPLFSLPRVLIGIYLAGLVAFAIRMVAGWMATRRLQRGSQPIADVTVKMQLARIAASAGLRRPPRLSESPQLFVPVTMSVTRPILVLPTSWRAWDSETRAAVLAHEVSHVARRDALTQHASLIYRAVFWFSPLAWWLRHQLVELAERASDEAVLDAGTSQSRYARMLIEFFRAVPQTGHRADWHVGMARGTAASAEARIERILTWKGGPAMRRHKAVVFSAVLVMTSAAVVTASVRPVASVAERTITGAMQPEPVAVSVPVAVPQASIKAQPAAPSRPSHPRPVLTEVTAQPLDAAAIPQTPASASTAVPIQTGFGAGAYRPGGGVPWPVAIQSPKPSYTDDALDKQIAGLVELDAVVLPDGTVGPVRLTKSLDAQYGLDNEAIRTVRQWVFKPSQLNGEPVAVVAPFQLEFRSRTSDTTVKPTGDATRLRPLADDFANGAYLTSGDDGVTPRVIGSYKYTPDEMRVKLTEHADHLVARIGAPRVTREVMPTYTSEGLRAKIEGPVDVEVVVLPDGTVGKARVVRSLDTVYGLDQQALAAAREWKFLPGTLDGKPAPVLVTIPLAFKIRPAPPAGKWTIIRVNSPDQPEQCELVIEATSVTGTCNGSEIRGEFADGRLRFASPKVWDAFQQHILGTLDQEEQNYVLSVATVNADGTLTGYNENYLRGYGPVAIKRWTWKATRAAGK